MHATRYLRLQSQHSWSRNCSRVACKILYELMACALENENLFENTSHNTNLLKRDREFPLRIYALRTAGSRARTRARAPHTVATRLPAPGGMPWRMRAAWAVIIFYQRRSQIAVKLLYKACIMDETLFYSTYADTVKPYG